MGRCSSLTTGTQRDGYQRHQNSARSASRYPPRALLVRLKRWAEGLRANHPGMIICSLLPVSAEPPHCVGAELDR